MNILIASLRQPIQMSFVAELLQSTRGERSQLLSAPAIGQATGGGLSATTYLRFLREAYSFTSYLEPVVWAAGSRCGERYGICLQQQLYSYGQEVADRTASILDDMANLARLAEPLAASPIRPTTVAMNNWVLSLVGCPQPWAMLGVQFVTEGSAGALAAIAAERLRMALPPVRAFSFLESHRILDPLYRERLDRTLESVPRGERNLVVHTARAGLTLYARFLGGIDRTADFGEAAVGEKPPPVADSLEVNGGGRPF